MEIIFTSFTFWKGCLLISGCDFPIKDFKFLFAGPCLDTKDRLVILPNWSIV